MGQSHRAARAAFVVLAGAVTVLGASSHAAAQQQAHPMARAATPPPERQRTGPAYPGATVTYGPGWVPDQHLRQPYRNQRYGPYPYYQPPVVAYYVYPPEGYGYGYGGGVTDANGRPLYSGVDAVSAGGIGYGYGLGTPDLTGAPYLAVDGGAMIVDFGGGDRRTIRSCAVIEAEHTPEGRPRTIFYRPPLDGLVLREGETGRVAGRPAPGVAACYTSDEWGRVVLAW